MTEYLDSWDAVALSIDDNNAEFEVILRGKITGAEIVGGVVTEVTIAGQDIKICDNPVFNFTCEETPVAFMETHNVKIRKLES